MKQKEVIDLIKLIDRCYKTDYAGDKEVVNDWFKILKQYELEDIMTATDNYMKYNTNYAPKVYDLTRNCATIEYKKRIDNAKTRCMFCMKEINFGDTAHEDKCRSIEFIRCTVKRFKNQDIDVEKYRKMGDEEFKKYYISAIKLVISKSNNETEVKNWKKYLESIE